MTYRRVFTHAYKSYKHAVSSAFGKYLFFTNVFMSMSMSTAGDLIEQNYEIVKGELDKIDLERTTQMTISGMTSGIICHHWCKMQALGMTWRKLALNMKKKGPMTQIKQVVRVAFSEKYLFFTNVTISVSLSCLGDVIEQHYEIYTKDLEKYDVKRTMVMGFSGAALGTLCHHWYKVLDKFIIGKTFDMVVKKLTLDQIIFSPIMIITFFGSVSLFEDDPIEDFKEEVKDKFVTLYRAEWTVWPLAQVINFYFLPTKYRVLYDNTISLGYDIYTSQVKHCKNSKQIKEKDS